MRKISRFWLSVAAIGLLGTTAWGGFFLKGARKAEGDHSADVMAKYSIEPCVMIADGAPAGAAAVEYWLIKDGPGVALFERDSSGEGSIIENQWTEEDGRHFFVWVKGSHGWEYVIPEDSSADALRLVYPKGTFKREKDDQDVTRPKGEPTAKCDLKPKAN